MPDENGRRPSRTGDQVKEPKKSISETTLQIHEYSTGRDRARQDTQDEIATTYRRALEPEIRGVKVGQKGKSDIKGPTGLVGIRKSECHKVGHPQVKAFESGMPQEVTLCESFVCSPAKLHPKGTPKKAQKNSTPVPDPGTGTQQAQQVHNGTT